MQRIALLLFLATTTLFSQSQTDLSYYLPQDTQYNASIPTPQSVIGHNVGEWHITHDKLVEYMKALANASNRITIEERSKTFENRPLLLLTITAPENHNNINAIQSTHIEATETNSANSENRPIVVYQGFSIHGNEPSGSNAALLVAYYLAAAEGSEIENLLKNTVILSRINQRHSNLSRDGFR